jgi:hypothetical protein
LPTLGLDELGRMARPVVVYVSAAGRERITAAGLPVIELAQSPDYRVTRPDLRFLDPAQRATRLETAYLLMVVPR